MDDLHGLGRLGGMRTVEGDEIVELGVPESRARRVERITIGAPSGWIIIRLRRHWTLEAELGGALEDGRPIALYVQAVDRRDGQRYLVAEAHAMGPATTGPCEHAITMILELFERWARAALVAPQDHRRL